MGVRIRDGVPFGGSSNSADRIKYSDTQNVKEKIEEVENTVTEIQTITTGTVTALVGTSTNYTYLKKIGLIKKLQFLFSGVTVAKSAWVTIGEVSADFYPSEIQMFNIRDDNCNVYGGRITTDGKISIISQTNALSNVNLAGEVMYF